MENRGNGTGKPRDKPPGRRYQTVGDFVYNDPYVGALVSRAHTSEHFSLPRTIPAGHPTGIVFRDDYVPPGYFADPMLDDEVEKGVHL